MMRVMSSKVCAIGDRFLEIKEAEALIMFGKEAPQDLLEYCVIVESHALNSEIKTNMNLYIGKNVYRITAVGTHVNHTLKTLGHATIYFDGSAEAKLPGCIHVENRQYPEIEIGDDIYIQED